MEDDVFDVTDFDPEIIKEARIEEPEEDQVKEDVVQDDSNKHEEEREPEDAASSGGSSPNDASSIAALLKEAGILSSLNDDDLSNVKSYNELGNLFDVEVSNRLSKEQKRIKEALEYGIEPTEIQKREVEISNIESYTDEVLEDESNEQYRCNMIFSNLVRKGLDPEDAKEIALGYVDKGLDVQKAKAARDELLKASKEKYNKLLEEKKKEKLAEEERSKSYKTKLKDSIFNDSGLFSELNIPSATRQKIYDTIVNPIDPKDKRSKSELTKYMSEHSIDANKWFGMFYVLTDGFTNMSKIFDGPIKKGVNKKMENLAKALENSNIRAENDLTYKSGVSDEILKNIDLGNFELV